MGASPETYMHQISAGIVVNPREFSPARFNSSRPETDRIQQTKDKIVQFRNRAKEFVNGMADLSKAKLRNSLSIAIITTLMLPQLVTAAEALQQPDFDVLIYGCGLSGVAAGIQAARMDAHVGIIEETDWCGGQATAAGEGNMDISYDFTHSPPFPLENKMLFHELDQRLLNRYGGKDFVGQGLYFSQPITHSYEPHVIKEEIDNMFAEERAKGKKIDVLYNRTVQADVIEGDKLIGIDVFNAETNKKERYTAKQTIDASEHGDVIRLSPGFSRSGVDIMPGTQTDTEIQSITYVPIVQQFPKGQVPKVSQFSEPPPGWTPEIDKSLDVLFTNGETPWQKGEGPSTWPKDDAGTKGYRGMPRILSPDTYTGGNPETAAKIQKAAINFLANDIPILAKYNTNLEYRRQKDCQAKVQAMYLLYKFQELGWDLAITSEEGYQNSSYNAKNRCTGIIPDTLWNIESRMPLIPYVRESNRLVGQTTLASATIRYQKSANYGNPDGPWRGYNNPNAIADCGYAMDFHQIDKSSRNFDPATDDVYDAQQKNEQHGRYQLANTEFIPLQVAENKVRDGLLAAGKNFGSRGEAAASRTQPCEVTTGQAVGAIAALAAKRGIPSIQVPVEDIKQSIRYQEAPLPLYSSQKIIRLEAYWQLRKAA